MNWSKESARFEITREITDTSGSYAESAEKNEEEMGGLTEGFDLQFSLDLSDFVYVVSAGMAILLLSICTSPIQTRFASMRLPWKLALSGFPTSANRRSLTR